MIWAYGIAFCILAILSIEIWIRGSAIAKHEQFNKQVMEDLKAALEQNRQLVAENERLAAECAAMREHIEVAADILGYHCR